MSRLTELIDIDGMKIKTSKERPLSNQGLGAILHKLYAFEDLEDELGCPLDVVFKALKEGVSYNREDVARTYNVKEWLDFATRPRLYYSDDFECWCFELFLGGYVLQLKDYQKTWWLKGDRSE